MEKKLADLNASCALLVVESELVLKATHGDPSWPTVARIERVRSHVEMSLLHLQSVREFLENGGRRGR